MIQRKQTIWLLLAAIAGFLAFKLPFYTKNALPVQPGNLADAGKSVLNASSTFLLIVTQATAAMLAVVIIFLYKKRVLQIQLCVVGLLVEALLIFLFYRETKNYSPGTYSLTALLQGAIVFLYFIAARDINSDEKKVKESDKLR